MAISFVDFSIVATGGATGTASASSNSNLPNTTAVGDRVFLHVVSVYAINTPSGWSVAFPSTQLGTGTVAAAAGFRHHAVFYRDYDGTWTMPTTSSASGAAPTIASGAMSLRKAAGETWNTPVVTSGSDTSTGTGFSVTGSSISIPTGAFVMICSGTSDNVTMGSHSLTAAGVTFSGGTERHDNGSATGNDVALHTYTAAVTTGATAAPTFAYTASAATDGGAVFVVQTVSAAAPGQGAATGSWSFDGTSTGKRPAKGAATGSFNFDGTSTGKKVPKSSATGSFNFDGSATGKKSPRGAATGSWSFDGTSTGKKVPKGTATGSFAFDGTSTGKKVPKGAATGAWGFDGTAAGGQPPPRGAATGSWGFDGTSTGKQDPKGAATGSWGFDGASAGKQDPSGSATGSWGYQGLAVGKKYSRGDATGAWGFDGSSTGERDPIGTATGEWGFDGTATGEMHPSGSATGTWGFEGTAVGRGTLAPPPPVVGLASVVSPPQDVAEAHRVDHPGEAQIEPLVPGTGVANIVDHPGEAQAVLLSRDVATVAGISAGEATVILVTDGDAVVRAV